MRLNRSFIYGLTFVLCFISNASSAMRSLLPPKYDHLNRLYELHSFRFGDYTITPVCTGFISTRKHHQWQEPEAVFIWLLQSKSGTVLIDTGLSEQVNDKHYFPSLLNFFFRKKFKFYLRPEEMIVPMINTDSVNKVLLTHAHFDHTGTLASFANSEILLSGKEFKAASGNFNFVRGYIQGTLPSNLRYTKYGNENSNENKITLNKSDEIFPGLYAVPTYEHTQGHLAFILHQNGQYICFTGDEGDNIVHESKPGRTEKNILDFAGKNSTLILNNHDNKAVEKLGKWIEFKQ